MKSGDKTGEESSRAEWDKTDGPSTDLVKKQEIKTVHYRYKVEKQSLFHPAIIPWYIDKVIQYYQSKWSESGYL